MTITRCTWLHCTDEPQYRAKWHQQPSTVLLPIVFSAVHACVSTSVVSTRRTSPCKLQVIYTAGAIRSLRYLIADTSTSTTPPPPDTSCRGSRPSSALVGAGCRNQLQVAQEQGLVRDCALVQAAIDVFPLPARHLHTNVHTHKWACFATCTVWWWLYVAVF